METSIISKVASVAKISLSDTEKKKFEKDLEKILESFSVLDKADVAGVEPTFQPVGAKRSLRDDVEEKCLTQQEALANTPLKEKGYFKGPKAI